MLPIKAPNTDDLFTKWLQQAPGSKIENVFGISKTSVSIAESVQETDKSVLFYFSSKVKSVSEKPKTASKPEVVKAEQLKKYDFYSFHGKQIRREDWKEKNLEVYSFDDLKEKNCSDCSGKGYTNCKDCSGKGLIACKKCDNKGTVPCTGKCENGKLVIEVEVRDEKGKKTKKQVTVHCPECYGENKIPCPECGGKGGTVCQKCRASGKKQCKTCDGTGKLFEVYTVPVPIITEAGIKTNFFYSKKYAKELSSVGKDLTEMALKEVEGMEFKDLKKLNSKDLAQALGEVKLDKDIESNMKDAIKSFEELEKSYKKGGVEEPLYPLVAYPMSILYIETKKGKKFKLFSVGSEQRFKVLDRGF
ncbi:MAG: hypothetical protein ACFFD4_14120 [Candidatus Odinarchaeota archaeon]